jgi:hypothetical protein
MSINLSSVPEEEFRALTALMKDSSADDDKD